MKLSILVPVYNEEQTIQKVIIKLLTLNLPCSKEIIVIDDGSDDRTQSILKELQKKHRPGLKIFRHKNNLGKGKAIQTSLRKAKGDYLLIQDADLEYNPDEIKKLLQPIIDNKSLTRHIIAVFGSRFKNKKPSISPLYYFGNKFLTLLTNFLYGTKLTDMETGYKLLPANFMKSIKLKSAHFDIEPEITVNLIKAKIPIVEIPITYRGRTHLAGKKLTISDAFAAIKTLIYLRFI